MSHALSAPGVVAGYDRRHPVIHDLTVAVQAGWKQNWNAPPSVVATRGRCCPGSRRGGRWAMRWIRRRCCTTGCKRALNLQPDPVNNPAEFGDDAWWLLDEATLDHTGAAQDRSDADAQRWAEHAAAEVATDPRQDSVTRAAAETAAGGHASEAGRLELDATALGDRAQDSTAAAASAAPDPQVEPELGFTGGSETARLAAESYPHSIRTALARNGNPQRTPKARGRRGRAASRAGLRPLTTHDLSS